MNPLDLASTMIRTHEGVRNFPYSCSEGKTTIGVGRNLTDVGLDDDEIEMLFQNDLAKAFIAANGYAYFEFLNGARQAAIMDMAFQLGPKGLAGFKKMHTALGSNDYELAAMECLDSLYANQTPERAKTISDIIRTGEMPA